MDLSIRKSFARGYADHDWLKSWHTFSFADFADPNHMGFRSLRVINQDLVAPASGFPMHPHRDMEILSYLLQGELEHRDSLGNTCQLRPGDFQLMSTGSGVLHSEFNPSISSPSHVLQIWIRPERIGLAPSYAMWSPSARDQHKSKVLVMSPDGRDGSLQIHQDANVWRLRVKEGGSEQHLVEPGRGIWLQSITGDVWIGDHELMAGDALSAEGPGSIGLVACRDSELLLFDLK